MLLEVYSKSQNGSIWTPNQFQDLKFKLYKAQFTAETGTAFFYNPDLDKGNGCQSLGSDPIRTLPKSATLGITTISGADSATLGIPTTGRKLAGANNSGGSATIVGRGSSVITSLSATEGGTGYVVDVQ